MPSFAKSNYTGNIILAIPTRQRAQQLRDLLGDLTRQRDRSFQVIILNDGSDGATDHLLRQSQKDFPGLQTLKSRQPLGLPAARNAILSRLTDQPLSGPTYLAWLDDDIRVDEHFISMIRRYAAVYDGFCFRLNQEGSPATFDFQHARFLHPLLRPLLGRFIPYLGIMFGGFYIYHRRPQRVTHLNGGCLIYDLTRAKDHRFNEDLGDGTAVGEDTCFSYGLHRAGLRLWHIGAYGYIHRPPLSGGCRTSSAPEPYYWYWKHKLYIVRHYHGHLYAAGAILFSAIESVTLSIILAANLMPAYWKAVRSYD